MESQTSMATPSLSVVSLPDNLVAIAAANYLAIIDIAAKECLNSVATDNDIKNNDNDCYEHTVIVDDEQMIRALCTLQLESSASDSIRTVDYIVCAGDAKYINFYKVTRSKENMMEEENEQQPIKSKTRLLECTYCYRYGPHTKRITQLTVCTKSSTEACVIFADKFGEVNQFTITSAQLEHGNLSVIDNNNEKKNEENNVNSTSCKKELSSPILPLTKCEFLLQHLSTISAMYLSPVLNVSFLQKQRKITHNEAVIGANCEKIDDHTAGQWEPKNEEETHAECNVACTKDHSVEEQQEQCSLHDKRHLFTCDKEGHIRVSFYPETYIIDDFLWPHGKEPCSATTCIIRIPFCKHQERSSKADRGQYFYYVTGDYSGWIHFWEYSASTTIDGRPSFHLVASVNCNNITALQNSILTTTSSEDNGNLVSRGTVGAVTSLVYTHAESNFCSTTTTTYNSCSTCALYDGVCATFSNYSAVLHIPLSLLTHDKCCDIVNYVTENAICYTLDTCPLAMCACNNSSLFVVERNGQASLLQLAVKDKEQTTNNVQETHSVYFVKLFCVSLDKLFSVDTIADQTTTESIEAKDTKLSSAPTKSDDHVRTQWCRNLGSILKEVDVFAHWNYQTHTLRSSKCEDLEFDDEVNNTIETSEETVETNDCDADNSVQKSKNTESTNACDSNCKKRRTEESEVFDK